MKQVVIQGGEARVVDVSAPQVGPRNVLVRVAHSAISAGTETAGVQAAAEPLFRCASRLRRPGLAFWCSGSYRLGMMTTRFLANRTNRVLAS